MKPDAATESELLEILERFCSAFPDRDAEAVMRLFVPDSDVVGITSEEPLLRGTSGASTLPRPLRRRSDDLLVEVAPIPRPILKVQEGTGVTVNVENERDLETTVHWHGLRIDRYDGTQATQKPIGIGEHFEYRPKFPTPGAYWYHPHIRPDYGQELGLYGNILVVPADPDYWPPAHRE